MSSSDLSSISSESEAHSSSFSSPQSLHDQQSSSSQSQDSHPKRSNKKKFSNRKSLQLRKPHFQRSKSSTATSIFPLQQKKRISFNLNNQEDYLDDPNIHFNGRSRKKSRFSNTEIVSLDQRQSRSLQFRRQKSEQLQIKRKASDVEISTQPQSILKKSFIGRSNSMVEGFNRELNGGENSPMQRQNSIQVQHAQIEQIPNNQINQQVYSDTYSPKNQFQFKKDSRNSYFSHTQIGQESPLNSNDSNKINNNSLIKQSNDYKQLGNKNKQLELGFEQTYHQVQQLNGLNKPIKPINNLNELSQQSNNSNYSLNNLNSNNNSNGGGNTPNSRNGQTQYLNSSMNTPPSTRNNKKMDSLNNIGNNGGFSDYVLYSSNPSSQAITNVNSATSITNHNHLHRSPSQQQIVNKKKDYQEVLRELLDTQDKLREEEVKNLQLIKQLQEKDKNYNLLAKQKQILQQRNSTKQNILKEVKRSLNTVEKRNNLIPIYIPFNQRAISKLKHLYQWIFHTTMFIDYFKLEKQSFFNQNTLNYAKNSIYIYNLLFLNSFLSLLVIIKLLINNKMNDVIPSLFYSAFGTDITPLFTLQILVAILVILLAQSIHLSHAKGEEVRGESKNLGKMSALKLVFSQFDFKEGKCLEQVEFYKENTSKLIKQYLKKNNPYKHIEQSQISKISIQTIRFVLNVGVILVSIYANKIQLEQIILNNLMHQGMAQSFTLIGISEIASFFIKLIYRLTRIEVYPSEVDGLYKMQFFSTLILFSYQIISYFNIIQMQEEFTFLPQISTQFSFINNKEHLQVLDYSEFQCPEKIVSYLLMILMASYFCSCIFFNVLHFIWNKICTCFSNSACFKKNKQQFDYNKNNLRDCILLILIKSNQILFVGTFLIGLVFFIIKFGINILILRSSKVLNYSVQESFLIQRRFNYNLTYAFMIIFLFYFYLSSFNYSKFYDQEGQICGPLENNLSISKYIEQNLFSKAIIGQVYEIITWVPLVWMLYVSYLIRQWITESYKTEWEIEYKNQFKVMKQIKNHYQQKIERIQGKIENTKANLANTQQQIGCYLKNK